MFVPKLRASFHAVLMAGFTKLLTTPEAATGRPPPFAFAADKATVSRKTGQMHAIILMAEGVFIAFFLSVLLALAADGDGLAAFMVETLMSCKPLELSADIIRLGLVCTAFDGQSNKERMRAMRVACRPQIICASRSISMPSLSLHDGMGPIASSSGWIQCAMGFLSTLH